jgi:hypothetical protein
MPVAESFGIAATNLGGRLSLGPPPGGMILAQECSTRLIITDKKILRKILTGCFIWFINQVQT